jgi:hypothetical protein
MVRPFYGARPFRLLFWYVSTYDIAFIDNFTLAVIYRDGTKAQIEFFHKKYITKIKV